MEPEKMKVLCTKMREAGKTSFLEVVSYSEEECMRGAKLAVECGFDYLLGTLYYDSVAEYVKKQGLKYCPFAGKVSKSPAFWRELWRRCLRRRQHLRKRAYSEQTC